MSKRLLVFSDAAAPDILEQATGMRHNRAFAWRNDGKEQSTQPCCYSSGDLQPAHYMHFVRPNCMA